MADEPTGTPATDGGEQAGTPVADDGKTAGETLEQKVARLEAAHAQSLAEKSNLERLKRENEELQARLAQSTPPTTTPAPNTPEAFVAAKQQEIRELENYLAQYPNDVVAKAALSNAQINVGLIVERVQQARQGEATKKVKQDIAGESADDALKRRAEELYNQGFAADAKSALLMARGESYEQQEQKRREADAIAAAKNVTRPNTSGGGGSVSDTSTRTIEMSPEEYTRKVAAGDWKLIQQARDGKVTFKR